VGRHSHHERLLEAVDRGMWEHPEPDTLANLRQAYLDTEPTSKPTPVINGRESALQHTESRVQHHLGPRHQR